MKFKKLKVSFSIMTILLLSLVLVNNLILKNKKLDLDGKYTLKFIQLKDGEVRNFKDGGILEIKDGVGIFKTSTQEVEWDLNNDGFEVTVSGFIQTDSETKDEYILSRIQ